MEGDKEMILEMNARLAARALRVLAVATHNLKDIPQKDEVRLVERELVFHGLIAMIDPPREEAKKQ